MEKEKTILADGTFFDDLKSRERKLLADDPEALAELEKLEAEANSEEDEEE